MGEKRNAYRLLVGKPEGRRPLGRPRCRWWLSHKQARKQRGTGTLNTEGQTSMTEQNNSNFLFKQFLTLEDGQFSQKHVVVLKILKSDKC
jgi:hypothetical protein